ncbi:hypothetical protein ABZ299_35575 [Streptomyces sp. NPDC006184]|uniref:virginiamycin B lyase family protein n=1 Tax=Streptomyces sp. NPDC006184 TaxID=3155455 RepID=UPI0033A684F7
MDRIHCAAQVTRFPLPEPDRAPSGITRGPDGLVRYADQAGRTGRIGATGTVTVLPVPDGTGKVPLRLTAGPDRAVWFTEMLGNAGGRVRVPVR